MLDSERVRWTKDNELLKTEEFLSQNWEERLQAEFVSKLLAVIKVQTTASLMLLYNSLTKPESTLVIVPFFSAYLSIYYVHTLADTVVSARFFLCITYNVIVLHCVYVCQQSRWSVWKRPVQPTTAGYIMAISSLRSQRVRAGRAAGWIPSTSTGLPVQHCPSHQLLHCWEVTWWELTSSSTSLQVQKQSLNLKSAVKAS